MASIEKTFFVTAVRRRLVRRVVGLNRFSEFFATPPSADIQESGHPE